MEESFVTLGVDISKAHVDVHELPSGRAVRLANTPSGIKRLLEQFATPSLMVCEPSGGYERRLVMTLQEAGWPVALVNARQIRDFARAKGVLAKTDQLDAKVLAEYGRCMRPEPRHYHGGSELAAYVLRRRQLVELRRRERQALEHTQQSAIRDQVQQHIAELTAQIEQTEACMRDCIAAEQDQQRRYEVLTSCKGVAHVTASTLMAELPELGTLSHSQISALAGLAPFNQDSGSMRGSRHIRGGRTYVRRALYMAAVAAIKSNPDLKAFYQHLRAKGKHSKVAITAVMRKLLILLNSLLRDNRLWQPIY